MIGGLAEIKAQYMGCDWCTYGTNLKRTHVCFPGTSGIFYFCAISTMVLAKMSAYQEKSVLSDCFRSTHPTLDLLACPLNTGFHKLINQSSMPAHVAVIMGSHLPCLVRLARYTIVHSWLGMSFDLFG